MESKSSHGRTTFASRRQTGGPGSRSRWVLTVVTILLTLTAWVLRPLAVQAQSGKETFSYTGAGTYVNFSSSAGRQAYCADATASGPFGDAYSSWYYLGEASPSLLDGADPHALAWLVYNAYPNTSIITGVKASNPMVTTQTAVWMLQGRIDTNGNMSCKNRNVVSRGEISSADLRLAWSLAQQAKDHAGESGSWDTAAKIWVRPNGSGLQNMIEVQPVGRIELQKTSALPAATADNALYSLGGARYGIWTSADCDTSKHGTGTSILTDQTGHGTSDNLPQGTYYVKEISAPAGYQLDPQVYQVSVTAGKTASVTSSGVSEQPKVARSPIAIKKIDKEANPKGMARQGDGTTAGAQFSVSYYKGSYDALEDLPSSPARTWALETMDEEGGAASVATLSEACLVSGDELYKDEDGQVIVPLGTMVIRESAAPTGYRGATEDPTLLQVVEDGEDCKVVNPSTGQTWTSEQLPAELSFANEVIRGGVSLSKHDAETGGSDPLGGATLEGATYSVVLQSKEPVVMEGQTYRQGETVATLTTDEEGRSSLSASTLPYGTYSILESAAPAGYTLADESVWSRTFSIRSDNEVIDLATDENAPADQVIRGDLTFGKIRKSDSRRLANVPFLITSKTTGEAHVLLTDANGVASTEAASRPHTARPNANDAALTHDAEGELVADATKLDPKAGIWFSGSAITTTDPKDSLGALPYDTYTVSELRSAANEGLELVSFDITISQNGRVVDAGTVTNEALPAIATTLVEKKGASHLAARNPSTTLVDTVRYERLKTDGTAYELTGTLHLLGEDGTDAGIAKDPAGKSLTTTVHLTPRLSAGSVEVSFTFDSTDLAGKSLVCYEEFRANGKLISRHADPTDAQQTVSFPQIGTRLTDEDGNKEVLAKPTVNLTDTVSYQGLVSGLEYHLVGRLVDSSGAALTDTDGEPITAAATFVPASSSGETNVSFVVNGTLLAGKTAIATEELYQDGILYAAHADLADEEQTVRFPSLSTSASVKEDTTNKDSQVQIYDKVTYWNLTPDRSYRLEMALTNREDGKPLTDSTGTPLTCTTTFTPDTANGAAEATITVDKSLVEGKCAVAFERVYSGDTLVASHEDIDAAEQTVSFPRIQTTASDALSGTHLIQAANGATINDTVTYEGLIPGRRYSLATTAVNIISTADSTEAMPLDSKTSTEFVPASCNGSVVTSLPLDLADLGGSRLVVYENLELDGKTVASHEDPSSQEQAIWVPTLSTSAKDKADSDKVLEEDGICTIVDAVHYSGLLPNQEYEVEMTLVDRETRTELTDEKGSPLNTTVTIWPKSSDGEISIDLDVDTTGYSGHHLVVFETIRSHGAVVACHADLENEDQTLTVKGEVPKETPPKEKLPKTGAGGKEVVALVVGVVLLATAVIPPKQAIADMWLGQACPSHFPTWRTDEALEARRGLDGVSGSHCSGATRVGGDC